MRSYMSALKAVEEAGGKAWLVGDTARMIAMDLQPDVLLKTAHFLVLYISLSLYLKFQRRKVWMCKHHSRKNFMQYTSVQIAPQFGINFIAQPCELLIRYAI